MDPGIVNNIFERKDAVKKYWNEVFQYQYSNNKVYHAWCDALKISAGGIQASENIPFLPISFFKTHRVVCGLENPELIFESSGTTQSATSRHYVKNRQVYRQSFFKGFEMFYKKDSVVKLSDSSYKGWTNFYRSDDVSAVAYFYLDKPASNLKAIQPVALRTAKLRSRK